MDENLRAFFRKYEKAFSDLDFRRQADLFADSFISAGPKGAIAQDKAEFLAMGEKAAGFYRSIGQKSVRLISAEEIPISDDYGLVKTHWGATFEKTGAQLIEFDISYVVRKTGGEPQILMFITHQDEEEAMKRLGLIQEPQHA